MSIKISTLALAAGLALTSAAVAEGPQLSGVVEVVGLGGAFSGSGTWDYESESWNETGTKGIAYGSARLGFEVTPNLSMQFDGWVNRNSYSVSGYDTYEGDYSDSGIDLTVGTAGHLTYRADNGMFAGIVGALGEVDGAGLLGSAGVDFGFVGDTWRLYGQVGLTTGLTDFMEYSGLREQFAGLVGTYYLNDDLSISGQLQVANLTFSAFPDESVRTVGWGVSLDYRPEGSPVVLTAGYHGLNWNYADADENGSGTRTTHAVYAGIRVPFGVTADKSLKDQDSAHNLGLMSTFYGKFADN